MVEQVRFVARFPFPLGRRVRDEGERQRRLKGLMGRGECPQPWPLSQRARGEGNSPPRPGLLALCGLILLALLLLFPFQAHAQSPIRVGLVVQFAEGYVVTQCVTLSQQNPSGWDVLVAANIGVIGSPSGMGMAVCKIGDVGCPAEDCWCSFNSGENLYWSYWHLQDGRWVYSNLGASNYSVSQGAVEGWIWGNGRTSPPIYSYEQICAAPPTATLPFIPSPTATLTFTPLPTATFTSPAAPSATPVIASTLSPTASLPTATFTQLPADSSLPSTPTAQSITQDSLHTSTLTPSATVTLPFAAAMAATTVSPSQNLPQMQPGAPAEDGLDLESISLTATAVEASRQAELFEENGRREAAQSLGGFGLGSLDVAYLVFFAVAGGLLVLLLILIRRRGAL